MKKIYSLILNTFGWGIAQYSRYLPNQAVYVVAPHTSYWDGFWGLLLLSQLNIKYVTMAADWLFYWPLKYVMKYMLHSLPTSKTRTLLKKMKENPNLNLVMCPEGQLAPTDNWPNGYYRIAKKLVIPIIPVAFDYSYKTAFIGHPINPIDLDEKDIINELNKFYQANGCAKYPEKFRLNKQK